MGRKAVDLQGKTFGSLIVMKRADVNQNHASWLCRCQVCGKTCIVRGDNLLSGRTRTCGCVPKISFSREMNDKEMITASNSVARLNGNHINPYQNLANTIVAMAADDYRMALKSNNEMLKSSLATFFLSDWFLMLSAADGRLLMKKLDLEQGRECFDLFG